MAKKIPTVKVRENVYESIYNVVYTLEDLVTSYLEDYPEAICTVRSLLNELWEWDTDNNTLPEGWHEIDFDKLNNIGAIVTDIKTQIGK